VNARRAADAETTMVHSFADIAFTPGVRELQARLGSRAQYAALDEGPARGTRLGAAEAAFVAARDGFYQASVGETGWPYVQFRGGPAGFLKVLDERTIAYADFRGNRQYISAGNLAHEPRVALILMDYAAQRRLKVWGRARLLDGPAAAALLARLEVPSYRARVERAVVIDVEAFDWNCPQHITPRFTRAELDAATADRCGEVTRSRAAAPGPAPRPIDAGPGALGDGPLALVVSGVQQLTPRVRAYTLRAADGAPLPPVVAGAHVDLPIVLGDGRAATRRYSIASDPARRDAWEVAVLREDGGSGGSVALHRQYTIGLRLHIAWPGNDFALHGDRRPALLLAGGIGITPLRAMALALHDRGVPLRLHFAARSRREAAWADELAHALGPRLSMHLSQEGRRLDVERALRDAPRDAVIYACGPARLIDAVHEAATRLGAGHRVRSERFTAPRQAADGPIHVELRRSGRRIEVAPRQSILEAAEAVGVVVPSACRTGTCGTCATKVLAGTPEHRDRVLPDAAREGGALMCICVSRARTHTLALDL
jgi:hypothetical protein